MREVFNVLLQTNPRLLMVRRVFVNLAAHLGWGFLVSILGRSLLTRERGFFLYSGG